MKILPARQRGFSLIEIAIGLVVMGLVLGAGLTLLSGQIEQQKIKDTQKILEDAKEALMGYATNQTPPHLPCPDKTGAAGAGTANDGLEDVDPATGFCVAQEGNFPWATLGVADVDAWGSRLRYRVSPAFSSRAPAATFSLATAGTLRVCQAAGCALGTVTANNVPAVVLSHGRNRFGAITNTGAAVPAPAGADELANTNGDNDFVSHGPTAPGAAGGEFDDIVAWLPPGILFNRMVQGGKLP